MNLFLDIDTIEQTADVTEAFASLQRLGVGGFGFLHVIFGEAVFHSLHGETDLAGFRIDLDHAGFDFITFVQNVANLGNMITAQLGDVDQTVDLVGKFLCF